MEFRKNIESEILKKRPNLTPSSVKTYVSILFNISKKINPDNTELSFFENPTPIMDLLKTLPPASRKTRLSALFVLTGVEDYQQVMLEDCIETNEMYKQQKKSQKQQDGWVTMQEVQDLYNHFFNNVTQIFANKKPLNYDVVINYLLLACLGGISGIPPRRSLDYCEMKIKNYDVKTENYYKDGIFHFQIYKTAKAYGEQIINIKTLAPAFYKVLQKWIKINPTDYLLFGDTQQKFTSPQVTKRFNKLFGKKASTNILRHSYLSEKYGDLQKEMQRDSSLMGHSTAEQALYIKR